MRSYNPNLQSHWRIALLASQPIQYWTVGPPVASAGVDQFGQGLFHGLQFGNLGPDFFDMPQGRAAPFGAGAVLVAVKRQKLAALFYLKAKLPRPGDETQVVDFPVSIIATALVDRMGTRLNPRH